MDPDFWEFEIPEPERRIHYDELIQQEWEESPPLAVLLSEAEDWCDWMVKEFDTAAEAWTFSDKMLVEELEPYVRDLLPFYFLDDSSSQTSPE